MYTPKFIFEISVLGTLEKTLTNRIRGSNAVPIALIAPRYPRRRMFLICTIGTAAVS